MHANAHWRKMQSNAINELNQPQLTFATPTLAGTKLYPDCLMMFSAESQWAQADLSPQRHPQLHLNPNRRFECSQRTSLN